MDTVLLEKEQYDLPITKNVLESLPYKDKIIQKVVRRIEKETLSRIKEDTLGLLFEKLIREEERKGLGQFYTPQKVVDYIINSLDIKADSKILDPTCGCGVFLVTAYNHLKHINPNAINNLYGVDLNTSATKITRINLWLRNGQGKNSLAVLENNIKIGNSIVEDKAIDKKAFNWRKEFSAILDNGGFDFIIGNPPYVTLKNKTDYDINESFYGQIANGSTNAASLVIVKSYELIKEGGTMAFVLPKTLIRVNSYSKLRHFLLNNSKILQVCDLGTRFKDVRGEQVILFIQKINVASEIENNNVLVKVLDNNKQFFVPQKTFQRYNTFLMFEDADYYNLIEKIKGEKLKAIAKIFRGITISPNSNIITKLKTKTNKPIIKGNDISKFSHSTKYFLDVGKLKGNSSKLKDFKKNKIILQNIFSSESGIIACLDKKGNLNFDTVTNVVVTNDSLNLDYIYGLLNSKLINFYLQYVIFNKSKLTMHTDKVYLGEVPIKIVNNEAQKTIIDIVKKLNITCSRELLKELDAKVYKLYGINKKEQNMIENGLRQLMSEKSLW